MLFVSCSDDDDPPKENEEEVITDVTLTFTPAGGGSPLTFTATDPDGEGVQDIRPDGDIALAPNTTYTLNITLFNDIEVEDVTEEIQNEATAHQFFFAWTGDIFENPTGSGNYGDDGLSQGPYGGFSGTVIYADVETDYQTEPDDDGVSPRDLPVGLETTWMTGDATTDDEQFRVVLKHQPAEKNANSNSNTGEVDVSLIWDIQIQ
ncbi:MAG: hypothetical protein KI790_13380 [Cyclobacteriaceae bacterium]|nr:hypothetical protein [Cyclobacteriaceae bacterium HetDA_MAG_MS6]